MAAAAASSTTALESKHPFRFIRPFIDTASAFTAATAALLEKSDDKLLSA